MALQSEAGTALVAAKLTQGCLYCPEVPKNWRAHIGAHLLRRLRGSGEPQAQAKKKLRTENQIPYPQVRAIIAPTNHTDTSFAGRRQFAVRILRALGTPRVSSVHEAE